MQKERPFGVTILAVLYFIGGIGGIASGGFFLSIPLITAKICGAIVLLIGIIYFGICWGLWTMQSWAWTVSIIFAIIGLIDFPIGTIISIIILLYLYRPEIKAVFGKGPPVVVTYNQQQTYQQPLQSSYQTQQIIQPQHQIQNYQQPTEQTKPTVQIVQTKDEIKVTCPKCNSIIAEKYSQQKKITCPNCKTNINLQPTIEQKVEEEKKEKQKKKIQKKTIKKKEVKIKKKKK